MGRGADDKTTVIGQVDEVVKSWRQGDYVLGSAWTVHRFNPQARLTNASAQVEEDDVDLVEEEVRGLVVVTQTCDIVRTSRDRPFIDVVPLVEVPEENLDDVRKGRRPAYAFIPSLADQRLVAYLDKTTTLEKAVLLTWTRSEGCRTDTEARDFTRALARKHLRFAFPDDFVELIGKLRSRLIEKHDRQSDEGRALRALREIRVLASPDWSASEISLSLYFIRDGDQSSFEGEEWVSYVERWLSRIERKGRFNDISGIAATLSDMSAEEYVYSDQLDLDHLSSADEE